MNVSSTAGAKSSAAGSSSGSSSKAKRGSSSAAASADDETATTPKRSSGGGGGAGGSAGKRSRLDASSSSDAGGFGGFDVSVSEDLKAVLISDWDLVTARRNLFFLPARTTVSTILGDFIRHAGKNQKQQGLKVSSVHACSCSWQCV